MSQTAQIRTAAATTKRLKRRPGSGRGLVAFSVAGAYVQVVSDDLNRVGIVHRWLHQSPGAEAFRLYVLVVPVGRQAAKAMLVSSHPLGPMEPRFFRRVASILRDT